MSFGNIWMFLTLFPSFDFIIIIIYVPDVCVIL